MTAGQVEVRRAGAPDAAAVLRAMHALILEDTAGDPSVDRAWGERYGSAYVAELVARTDRDALVAVAGGEVVGVLVGVLLEPTPLEPVVVARLGSLYVEPDHRGSGVGGLLVVAFLHWARAHHAPYAQVTAYSRNHSAIRFYERHGLTSHHTVLRTVLEATAGRSPATR